MNKRFVCLFMAVALCLTLCACGGKTTTVTKENTETDTSTENVVEKIEEETVENTPQAVTAMVLGEKYSVADYADISLVSIESTKMITSAMDGVGLYYENSDAGQTYIDVIFEVTNTSTAAINSDDIMLATATSKSGTEYPCGLYVVETNEMTSLGCNIIHILIIKISNMFTSFNTYNFNITIIVNNKEVAVNINISRSCFLYNTISQNH